MNKKMLKVAKRELEHDTIVKGIKAAKEKGFTKDYDIAHSIRLELLKAGLKIVWQRGSTEQQEKAVNDYFVSTTTN